jgi:hypothetical protein
MTKIITQAQAEKRFYNKLSVDKYGHTATIEWTGTQTNGWIRSGGTSPRDVFTITCSKCDQSLVNRWRASSHTNADGSIPTGDVSNANYHFLLHKPEVLTDMPAEKIMVVHMKRAKRNTEFWIAHYLDDDFWDSTDISAAGGWRGSTLTPYMSLKQQSNGKWQRMGAFSSRDEAVGYCTKQKQRYVVKGYVVDVLDHTSSGHIPPAATVAISVKKLINEYKELRVKATPIEQKQWLDKVSDALKQLELLDSLYEEVRENFKESLEL